MSHDLNSTIEYTVSDRAKILLPDRRLFLSSIAAGSLLLHPLFRPGRFADELTATAKMGVGPFFPDRLPLDTDNDLLMLSDSLTPAVGQIVHLSGRVLSLNNQPLRNALVEIWQVDSQGSYLHSRGASPAGRDQHFQGYGKFLTDIAGRYYFRTIKPVPYGFGRDLRTPHIHFQVSRGEKPLLASQLMINGEPLNEKDDVLNSIRDPKLRATVLTDFAPLPNSKIGELQANFDIVLGKTLEELEDGTLGLKGRKLGR
jgi:protocatechuate 3,4-dioxygenase beta subunit